MHCLASLCGFGFGGWVGGLWLGSCNPLRLAWLGGLLCLLFYVYGGMYGDKIKYVKVLLKWLLVVLIYINVLYICIVNRG